MSSTVNQKISTFASPEEAFKRYADTVYRLAFVRTKNRSDSDDILQEVFIRYMKVWEKMESEEHVKAILLKITVNCSNSLKTSAWFKKTVPLEENLPHTDKVNDSSVLAEVMKLPIKYRTAIHLYYYCGFSVNEISKIEGIKIATVKTHLSRARAILKDKLKEDFDV